MKVLVDPGEDERIDSVVEKAMAAIDRPRYEALAARCRAGGGMKMSKYFLAPQRSLRLVAAHLVRLDLDRSVPLRILDISAGAGFLCLAARALGHDTYATDAVGPERVDAGEAQRLRVECCDLVGMHRPGHFHVLVYPREYLPSGMVYHFTPLPDFGVELDLITAMAVSPMSHWPEAEWRPFLADCARRCPRGRIYVKTNMRSTPSDTLGRSALLALDVPKTVYADGSVLLETEKMPCRAH
jgi:hypothetical protein